MNYDFDILKKDPDTARASLARRPIAALQRGLAAQDAADDAPSTALSSEASRYQPDPALVRAINAAVAVGQPLLLTGEPGVGKTQAAYYVAHQLGLGPVLHFQTKSTSAAQDLLYEFDSVGYFHAAGKEAQTSGPLSRRDFVEKGPLWRSFESAHPRVVLIDEIDKAPRDFPNDLLFELDQMAFEPPSDPGAPADMIVCSPENRPIVIITSNSERQLPEPFLRRCVYKNIVLEDADFSRIIEARQDQYPSLPQQFVQKALELFTRIRSVGLVRPPSTGELIAWLHVLQAAGVHEVPQEVGQDPVPFAEVLAKSLEDIERLSG